MSTADFTQNYLMYVVLPLWLLVGAADWACHRAARIEHSSGVRESLIHLLMLGEMGLPLLMALFLEINGLVILVMIGAWLLHELTSYWDVSYAASTPSISPLEQRVHDYLGAIPLMALSFILVLHWPQALALVGAGPEPPDLGLAWKQRPLPNGYVCGLLAAVILVNLLPFLEEFWRTLRARSAPQR